MILFLLGWLPATIFLGLFGLANWMVNVIPRIVFFPINWVYAGFDNLDWATSALEAVPVIGWAKFFFKVGRLVVFFIPNWIAFMHAFTMWWWQVVYANSYSFLL